MPVAGTIESMFDFDRHGDNEDNELILVMIMATIFDGPG